MRTGIPTWRPVAFEDRADVERFADQVRANLPITHINHDVEWLGANHGYDRQNLLVLADDQDGKLAGVAAFQIAPSHLEYHFGGLTLLRVPCRRLSMQEGPVTSRPDARSAIAACVEQLARDLPRRGVIFLGCVAKASVLDDLLTERNSPLRDHFHVLPWGETFRHCKIEWHKSFDTYLASVGSETRRNLKRYAKKFRTVSGAEVRLRRFQSPEDVSDFLKDGVKISDQTYQKKDLGLGLAKGGAFEREVRFAAGKGYFLGHILYADNEPIAFHYGYVFGKTYFVMQTGYDPKWSKWQVGSVVFSESLRDIEKHQDDIEILDFLSGSTHFKERTTNLKQEERDYFLLKKGLFGSSHYYGLKVVNTVSEWLGRCLERLNIKEPIKRLIQAWTDRKQVGKDEGSPAVH